MRYASVCSGIEAATVAWKPLGWECEFLSEIEKHPKSLLEDKYGHETTIYGDFTNINADNHKGVDVIIGGTPCQSFSMAGARGGLEDTRGNLSLEFIRLAKQLKSKWIVWENVPGVLSSGKGADLTTILSEFVGRELPSIKWSKAGFIAPSTEGDYGIAWRILDGQYFGVPQRRRRLFVVGYLGDWRPPCSVLFESESPSRDTEKSRSEGQAAAREVGESDEGEAITIRGNIIGREVENGGNGLGFDVGILPTLTSTDRHAVVHKSEEPMVSMGAHVGELMSAGDGIVPAITSHAHKNPPILFSNQGHTNITEADKLPTLQASMGDKHNIPIVLQGDGKFADVGEGVIPTMLARQYKSPPIVYSNDRNKEEVDIKQLDKLNTITAGYGTAGGHVPIVYENHGSDSRVKEVDQLPSITAKAGTGGGNLPIVVNARQTPVSDEIIPPLDTRNTYGVQSHDAIRYLTPRECERAMGFPDDYTAMLSKTQRYKALGNSMIVPVIQWLGQRIEAVDTIINHGEST